MKRYLLILAVCSCIVYRASAQQHGIYSQYLFNLFVVNPAYAGELNGLATSLSYRSQWLGFEGAPVTQNFSAHAALPKENMALGFQVQNDQIGARQTPLFALAYAYKLKLNSHYHLSLGLQAGMINYQYNWAELTYRERIDPVAYQTDGNRWIPNFDFGLMLISADSYFGLSATSLNNSKIIDDQQSEARLNTCFNLIAGKVFPVSKTLSLKPSTIVRLTANGPMQFDLNAGLFYKNKLWITTTYRYQFGLVYSAHIYVNDALHFGYSYDMPLNALLAAQSGTHELFVGYNFPIFKTEKSGPRQF